MKVLCDVCEKSAAVLLCCADEAALCAECDSKIHAANKLANKHQRVLISPPQPADRPSCDICQEKAAFFLCVEDRALLCRGCDVAIHASNSLSSRHRRFLLPNTRVGLDALAPDAPLPPQLPSAPASLRTGLAAAGPSAPGRPDATNKAPVSALDATPPVASASAPPPSAAAVKANAAAGSRASGSGLTAAERLRAGQAGGATSTSGGGSLAGTGSASAVAAARRNKRAAVEPSASAGLHAGAVGAGPSRAHGLVGSSAPNVSAAHALAFARATVSGVAIPGPSRVSSSSLRSIVTGGAGSSSLGHAGASSSLQAGPSSAPYGIPAGALRASSAAVARYEEQLQALEAGGELGEEEAGEEEAGAGAGTEPPLPDWRVDELLNIPELAEGYTLADIGSSKAENNDLGDFDWTADLSLFDEQVYAESMHVVPELSFDTGFSFETPGHFAGLEPAPGQGVGAAVGAAGSAMRMAAAAAVPDLDDSCVVPDVAAGGGSLGIGDGPSKRRRNIS